MSQIIETQGLSRTYKSYQKQEGLMNSIRGFWNRKYIEKKALEDITISIEPGQIVGLVGANGAGKTTLLKLLSGLITPTSGTAKVLGYRPSDRKFEFLRRISLLLGQKNQLWWDLTPKDSYQLLGKIYDLDVKDVKTRVKDLSEMLDCAPMLEIQLRRLSLGERMKMEIIGALLHQPDILFLDEPTIGLDIVAQSKIRDFLKKYVTDKSPTIILTSHYMDDISILAQRLLLVGKGRLLFDGTVEKFVSQSQLFQLVSFKIKSPLLNDIHINDQITLTKGKQEFEIKVLSEELDKVLPIITQAGAIQELQIQKAALEDVMHKFLQTESRVL